MKVRDNKVLKAGVGYTIGNYLIKGLTFLTIPIFSRLLSTVDYGVYSTYIAYEAVMTPIIGLALHMSLKNARYKFPEEYTAYISSITLFEILSLFVWLILGILLSPTIKNLTGFSNVIVIILVIQCVCSSLLAIYNTHLSLTYSYQSYVKAAGFNAVFNVITSVVLINMVFENRRYLGRLLGTLVPLIVLAAYIVCKFWRVSTPKIRIKYWRFALTYSIPLIPHAISQVILNQFDRIMISHIVGTAEAGIYSFAYNIYLVIEVTKTSLDNVWGPWFYEKYKKGEISLIRKKSTVYAGGMFLFNSIIMLSAPEMVKILGTDAYSDAAYVVIPICAAGYFSFLYTLPAQVEYYREKTKFIAMGTVFAAVLNIILNAVFINRFGYAAAAYTTEFTYIIYFAMHYYIASKIVNEKLFSGKMLILLSSGCVGVSILGVFLINVVWLRLALAMVITITFLLLLIKCGLASHRK